MTAASLGPIGRAKKELYDERRLAYVVPVRADDRVLVLGSMPTLTTRLKALGAHPVTLLRGPAGATPSGLVGSVSWTARSDHLPQDSASFDHLICPSPLWRGGGPSTPMAEYARVLRPGGWVCFGAAHRARAPLRRDAWTISTGARRLSRAGFTAVEVYGVKDRLPYPRFLVPVTNSEALRWYLSSVHLVESPRAARFVSMAILAPRTPLPRLMFTSLLFVGQRPGPSC